MPPERRRVLAVSGPLLVAAALAARPAVLRAQGEVRGWPDRPIRVIVPYSAGGQSDTVLRLLAPQMGEFLGQPIVAENRTGAGGTIGAGMVAGSRPDGHTLLFEGFAFVVLPMIHAGLPFSYETAFVPVAQAVALPYVLAVRRDFPPPHSLAGFLAEARRAAGRPLTYGTPGIGTPGHLAGALLERRAGIRLEHRPYRGGQDAARDLAAGQLDAAIATASSLRPLVQEGRAHGVALTSAERRGSMAELPTVAESGLPGFDIASWNGLFAVAGTPEPVLRRLEAAVHHALADPGTLRRLALAGNDAVAESSAAFADRIRRDREVVRRIVQETGMRIQ